MFPFDDVFMKVRDLTEDWSCIYVWMSWVSSGSGKWSFAHYFTLINADLLTLIHEFNTLHFKNMCRKIRNTLHLKNMCRKIRMHNVVHFFMGLVNSINMITSTNGNIFRVMALCDANPPVTGGFPSQRPVTQDLMFSLICAWTNCRVNNRNAYLRRHRAHYDVIVINHFVIQGKNIHKGKPWVFHRYLFITMTS